MKLHTAFLCMALSGFADAAMADSLKCIGQDENGTDVRVLINWDTNSMIVDGRVRKIIDTTKDKKGVATEDYKADDGSTVYDSVTVDGDTIIINQYESKGDKFIASVELACTKVK